VDRTGSLFGAIPPAGRYIIIERESSTLDDVRTSIETRYYVTDLVSADASVERLFRLTKPESIAARSKISGGFHGLRQIHTGSALPSPVTREPSRRCRLLFMMRTGHLLHPASTPASQPDPGVSLPGTLASPRTGLSPTG
jgi:hypothetical protein